MKKILSIFIIITMTFSHAFAMQEAAKDFLDMVEKEAFNYFWNETNPKTGLTSNTTEFGSPATNAASGFMLSALIIGIERGWISRDAGYDRALTALKTYTHNLERFNGFTYHYFDKLNGRRMWLSEISCIDTALFLSGVLTIGEYFKGTEVEKLADQLFKETDWKWFLNNENVLQMSWKPERGFSARIDRFSEGILAYILALGSPTHPIPAKSWDSFLRPVTNYAGMEIIYVADGSLFQYLFPLAWLDMRNKHDSYADYWQNAINAVKANKEYCLKNNKYKTFREGYWGLSASLSPSGYKIFGAKPGNNKTDGTVAPYVVGGSIALTPEFSIADYMAIYKKMPKTVGKYGLTDAFNIDAGWVSTEYISIDTGLTLLMVENYRTGLIWKYFMKNQYVKKGMELAGFLSGAQTNPSKSKNPPGNPFDSISIKKKNFPIIIDGNLSEWPKDSSRIELTSKDNKNVEIILGYIRDDSDVSGKFLITWDNENFYIAGHVKDDEIVCNNRDDKIYKDDCVEIFFDTDKNGFKFDGNSYDYQIGLAPEVDNVPQIWSWGNKKTVPKDIEYAVRELSGGYDFEMAIPFSEIANFKPNSGNSTLFSISIHDRDKNDKDKKLTWSVDSYSQPGQIIFGKLTLKND